MSPARETTAERPRRKRRRATKAAGVTTNYPWSDPKHGIVFKKHIVRDEDGVQVESNLIIASRLHEALIRCGSVRLPDDGQTIEEGTLPAASRARWATSTASRATPTPPPAATAPPHEEPTSTSNEPLLAAVCMTPTHALNDASIALENHCDGYPENRAAGDSRFRKSAFFCRTSHSDISSSGAVTSSP